MSSFRHAAILLRMSQPRQVLKVAKLRVVPVLTQLRHVLYREDMSEPAIEYRGEIPPWTLGWRLQRSLAWAEMTTEQMADELGIARSTVSRWCNDKGRPTKGYLKLWALRTGVPLSWLTPEDDKRSIITALIRDPQPSTADILAMRKALGHGQRHPNARAGLSERNTS